MDLSIQGSQEAQQNELLNMPSIADGNEADNIPATTSANASASDNKKLSKKDLQNYYGRWVENDRFIAEIPEVAIASVYTSGNTDFDSQLFGMIGKVSGLFIVSILHKVLKPHYVKAHILNPLYRRIKTLATAGIEIGLIFSNLRLLPMILSTAIFSVGMALLSIIQWGIREYLFRPTQRSDISTATKTDNYTLVGPEGWTKYGKTFLVFGMYLGEVVGSFFTFIFRGDFIRNIALAGAIGSVVSFIGGLIAVPLINRLFNKRLITDKDVFRNNYVRSGITLGVAVGSILGFIVGSVLLPGLGSAAGIAIGAAFGSVIGGISIGAFGKKITDYLRRAWKVPANTDNSWDYSSRNMSYLFGFIGATVGFFVPVPGGTIAGLTLGTAVGSAVGWLAGFVVIRAARKVSAYAPDAEHPSETLPWTQRIANGTMVGSMLGASVGFLFGLIGGIPGAVIGGTLGYSIGATLGGIGYGLYDSVSRKMLGHLFTGTTWKPEKRSDNAVTPPATTPVLRSVEDEETLAIETTPLIEASVNPTPAATPIEEFPSSSRFIASQLDSETQPLLVEVQSQVKKEKACANDKRPTHTPRLFTVPLVHDYPEHSVNLHDHAIQLKA